MRKIAAASFMAGLLVVQFALADAAAAGDARVACKGDYQRLCNNVSPGGGRIAQCFKQHESELSSQCKTALVEAKAERDKTQGGESSGGAPAH